VRHHRVYAAAGPLFQGRSVVPSPAMLRWLALLALAVGCPRSAAPAASQSAPAAGPGTTAGERCPAGATHTPESDICLMLPPNYQLVRREQEPAFDRRTVGYARAGDSPAEIRLDIQWFPNGRSAADRERDFASELAQLQPDAGDLEFDTSTDDATGRFVRVRVRRDGGEENEARSLVRTAHFRVRCAVDLPGIPDLSILDACRTLRAPP
jgi:hypothetical protein